MEEMIAIICEFDADRMFRMKRTIHEEGIVELMKWKVREIKRENPEFDEEGNIVNRKPKKKKGSNTIDDLMLASQVFARGSA